MAEWLALQNCKHGDSGSYPAEVENFSEEFSVCECVSVCVCSREQDIKGRDVFIGICSSAWNCCLKRSSPGVFVIFSVVFDCVIPLWFFGFMSDIVSIERCLSYPACAVHKRVMAEGAQVISQLK